MSMEFNTIIFTTVSILGFSSVTKSIFSLLRWVWITFLRPPKNLKEYGSWAIVTGSTDGIGKALAFELASKGLNLISIGRNPSKLENTANEIRERCNSIDIRSIVIDFEKVNSEEICKEVERGIEGLDVGILVNNAGLGYSARFFHEAEVEFASVNKVNLDGATWVTKAVVPIMLKKQKGAIVNIGSASTVVIPSYPFFSVYAATKAYLAMFSRCIGLEYKQKGIDVQCQIPLFVATKMTKLRPTFFFIPSAESYSKASIRWIGHTEHICLPYWPHYLQWCMIRALPDAFVNWFMFRYFLEMRKKEYLKDKLHES